MCFARAALDIHCDSPGSVRLSANELCGSRFTIHGNTDPTRVPLHARLPHWQCQSRRELQTRFHMTSIYTGKSRRGLGTGISVIHLVVHVQASSLPVHHGRASCRITIRPGRVFIASVRIVILDHIIPLTPHRACILFLPHPRDTRIQSIQTVQDRGAYLSSDEPLQLGWRRVSEEIVLTQHHGAEQTGNANAV